MHKLLIKKPYRKSKKFCHELAIFSGIRPKVKSIFTFEKGFALLNII